MQQFEFDAIGTQWRISYDSSSQSLEIENKVRQRIERFDRSYSRFRKDSLVALWAREAGEYELPDDAQKLFSFYKKLYDATNGLVTPLIGKTLEQAGYDAEYSLKPKDLTAPLTWEDTLEFPGPGNRKNAVKESFVMKRPVLLDFGAAGKGYLVDIVAYVLYKNGINQFCVNAGGDMIMRNLQQTIGLEDPDDTTRVLGTVKISDGALCASAGNRRIWGRFHHIINPKTLRSPQNIKATWVRADSAMVADGMATALFFVASEILQRTFDFDYVMIENDDMKVSKNFKAEFFTK